MGTLQLLLVDDEARFLSTTKILLEKRGADILTASNGPDALRIIDDKKVDVVILDVKMPGMDGVEVLRKIKKEHPFIEVIMLTGYASVESAVEGLKLGAFDYVMKPCDIDDIWAKVKDALAGRQAKEEKHRKSAGGIIDKRRQAVEKE